MSNQENQDYIAIKEENTQDKDSQLIRISKENKKQLNETYSFKFGFFCEFFYYYFISFLLGPLSYFIFKCFHKENGSVLVKNLHVLGDSHDCKRIFLWLAKVYCVVASFFNSSTNTSNSVAQFYMLVYTDFSLIVLNAAYYCSFYESQIIQFRKEVIDHEEDIFKKIMHLFNLGRESFFKTKYGSDTRTSFNKAFPEIDFDNFNFIFSAHDKKKIPEELEPVDISQAYQTLKPIKRGFVVRGEKYAAYIANESGYKALDLKVTLIKLISRTLIFIRLLIPIIISVYNYLSDEVFNPDVDFFVLNNLIQAGLFLFQQIAFLILLYRFVNVLNVILLGLFLYYQKLELLLKLSSLIKLRSTDKNDVYSISLMAPQNIQNWYCIRKMFRELNKQVFVIIDINMSYVLFFVLFFVFLVVVVSLGFVNSIPGLAALSKVFTDNPELITTTVFYMLTLGIVLLIDLGLVAYLNFLFGYDSAEFYYHLGIMQTMRVNSYFYTQKKLEAAKYEAVNDEDDDHAYDLFRKYVLEIKDYLQQDFEKEFFSYVTKLRDSVNIILEDLNNDEENFPNTLLGIPVNRKLLFSIVTALLALGVTSIGNLVSAFKSFSSQ